MPNTKSLNQQTILPLPYHSVTTTSQQHHYHVSIINVLFQKNIRTLFFTFYVRTSAIESSLNFVCTKYIVCIVYFLFKQHNQIYLFSENLFFPKGYSYTGTVPCHHHQPTTKNRHILCYTR